MMKIKLKRAVSLICAVSLVAGSSAFGTVDAKAGGRNLK